MKRPCQPGLVILCLVFAAAAPTRAEPCTCTPPGCSCKCECRYSGQNVGGTNTTCLQDQKAYCSCTESSCGASCSSDTDPGIGSASRFYLVDIEATSLKRVGAMVKEMDTGWTISFEAGVDPDADQVTKIYRWTSGVDLKGALDEVGADYNACVDVDYTNKNLTFRHAGGCS